MQIFMARAWSISPVDFWKLTLSDYLILEDAYLEKQYIDKTVLAAHAVATIYGMRAKSSSISTHKIVKMITGPKVRTEEEERSLEQMLEESRRRTRESDGGTRET